MVSGFSSKPLYYQQTFEIKYETKLTLGTQIKLKQSNMICSIMYLWNVLETAFYLTCFDCSWKQWLKKWLVQMFR